MRQSGASEASVERRDATRQLTAWCLTILAVIAVIAAAKAASAIVVPTILAGLIALTLTPVVAFLQRLWIPGPIAALMVMVCAASALAGGLYFLAPSAEEWRQKAPSIIRAVEWQLRDIEREIEDRIENVTGNTGSEQAAESSDGEDGEGSDSATTQAMQSGRQFAADIFLNTPEILATLTYVGFLCYFFLVEKASLRRFVLGLGPSTGVRLRLGRAMRDMRREVGIYLLTISIINTALGVSVAALLWQMGLPNPILWGAMATVLNFIPYIGPFILDIIVFLVAVGTFYDLVEALYPIAGLLVLHTIEGSFVTPMVVGHRVRVGALPVFLALAFFAWLWGILGALLAAPLLILGKNVWQHMRLNQPFVPSTVRSSEGPAEPRNGLPERPEAELQVGPSGA